METEVIGELDACTAPKVTLGMTSCGGAILCLIQGDVVLTIVGLPELEPELVIAANIYCDIVFAVEEVSTEL